jgi:hypothetical protein
LAILVLRTVLCSSQPQSSIPSVRGEDDEP